MILRTGFLNTVHNRPDHVAIIDGGTRFTYRQFGERVQRLAGRLQALGVEKGDRIGLLMLNSFHYLEVFYASFLIGAVVVPLNFRLAVPELSFILNDAGVKILFFHREFQQVVSHLREESPSIEHYVWTELEPLESMDFIFYESLLQDSVGWRQTDLDEHDVAGIFYTGGTTGLPKGVMLTHKNLLVNAFQTSLAIDVRPDDIYLHAAPMFHLADGASTVSTTLAGATHVHIRAFDPIRVMEAIQKERVNVVTLVPTMINMLVNHPEAGTFDLSSLKRLLYGASPIPVEVLKKAISVLRCRFYQAYGMTEASPVLTVMRPEDHVTEGNEKALKRLASCGQPIYNVELKIVDPEGNEVPHGMVGEIIARGPNIMKGYWNRPEETADALRDGWYWTGDMAAMDEDRFVYMIDRKKDMIVTGGENVYSVEVENVIYQHSAVLEAAVIGVPDEIWGEAVKAIVVVKPGQEVTEPELITHCRSQLANYKVPKTVELVESLPKSGAGKILKRTLRDQYWTGKGRSVN